ncbi:universal stress protein [Nocardioides dongkuii]|uniref:universal stress protein n=1 Tax=Nocardioides dongkuii TaxID=2760089 RepID=UPI0015FB8F9E|nr:universal stress protein [Nocardioides dongkuii]
METLSSTSDVPAGTVVVGVDGSDGSARAVRWAAVEAGLTHRPLTLVNGFTVQGTVWLAEAGIDSEALAKAIRDEAATMLEKARDEALALHPDLDVRGLVVGTDARDALEELSRSAAVLVVGSRGRGPVRSLLLGSVSVAVSKQAHCPVVVVRPGAEEATGGILVGVDGTPASMPALGFAYREASLRQLPLTVVHCFFDVQSAGWSAHQVPEHEISQYPDVEALLAEAMSGMQEQYPDVQVERALWRGLVDQALVLASRGRNLTVVGLRQTGPLRDLVQVPIAPAVVERADGAVAVVPHDVDGDRDD